jgi:hypothetical protein
MIGSSRLYLEISLWKSSSCIFFLHAAQNHFTMKCVLCLLPHLSASPSQHIRRQSCVPHRLHLYPYEFSWAVVAVLWWQLQCVPTLHGSGVQFMPQPAAVTSYVFVKLCE